jgi:POT family proton-dependent oligopeptide transporter
MEREATFLGHPVGLSFLFGTEMWERFCYYGMRAILTYYMVDFLFLHGEPQHVLFYGSVKSAMEFLYGPLGPQPLAALIYGLYTASTYLTGVIGGALADRVLGQRWCVLIGAITMATGEFLLTSPAMFFIGLLVLVMGAGMIKPNLTTQVGGLYKEGDSRIDTAYSIFYVGVNLGALIAPVICGRLTYAAPGHPQHWNYGFAAAGIGMLIGLVIFLIGLRRLPPDVRSRRMMAEAKSGASVSKLTARDRQAVMALILVAFCNLFFWGCYEQQGITIALMAQNNTNLSTWFGTLLPEDVQSFNPFFIFTLTPVIIALWARQARRGREPSPVTKMAIGCLATALCFGMLIIPSISVDAGQKVTVLWLVAAMAIQTVGELYLSPVGLSLFSRASPAKLASLMMGVNFLSNFAGNYMAGYLGSFWSGMPKTHFFAMIAGISAATSLAIFALSRLLNPILAEDRSRGTDAAMPAEPVNTPMLH